MSGRAGYVLLELLVASACVGLIAAATMTLLVGQADAVRARVGRIDADSSARGCADRLARDLQQVGRYFDGVPRLGVGDDGVATVRGSTDRLSLLLGIDAVPVVAAGPELVRAVGWAESAGVAVAAPRIGAEIPVGIVREVIGTRDPLLRIEWPDSAAAVFAEHGAPGTLVVLQAVDWRVTADGERVVLQRRVDGGRWQPITALLDDISFAYSDDPVAGAFDESTGDAVMAVATRCYRHGGVDAWRWTWFRGGR